MSNPNKSPNGTLPLTLPGSVASYSDEIFGDITAELERRGVVGDAHDIEEVFIRVEVDRPVEVTGYELFEGDR